MHRSSNNFASCDNYACQEFYFWLYLNAAFIALAWLSGIYRHCAYPSGMRKHACLRWLVATASLEPSWLLSTMASAVSLGPLSRSRTSPLHLLVPSCAAAASGVLFVDPPGTRLDRWVLAPSHRHHHHHHHHRRSCLRISIAPCVACRQSILALAWSCCLGLDALFDARLDPPVDPDLSLLILNLDLLALAFLPGKLVGSWKVGVPWAVKNDGEDGKLVWSCRWMVSWRVSCTSKRWRSGL